MTGEFDLIKKIIKKIPRRLQGNLPLGDDAGLLRLAAKSGVWVSTDTLVDGVDFRLGKLPPEAVGRKALAINLSDMAAMAVKPSAFVVSLGIPKSLSERWILRFYDGLLRMANSYKSACLGGDISRSRQFFATVTILGESGPDGGVCRSGAKSGDCIGVTGFLGGSILGHHFSFEPRVAESLFLRKYAKPHAMIDISDGFLQDLGHILEASGVSARLELESIPVSPAALKLGRGNSRKALEHALSDGEDFELMFTVSPAEKNKIDQLWHRFFPRVRLSWVGEITPGIRPIRWVCGGRPIPSPKIARNGFSHF